MTLTNSQRSGSADDAAYGGQAQVEDVSDVPSGSPSTSSSSTSEHLTARRHVRSGNPGGVPSMSTSTNLSVHGRAISHRLPLSSIESGPLHGVQRTSGSGPALLDEKTVRAYLDMKHGPDGDNFLDPIVLELISQGDDPTEADATRLTGKKLFDLGCGPAWLAWELACVTSVEKIKAIDIDTRMIQFAKGLGRSLGDQAAEIGERLDLQAGNVTRLVPNEALAFWDRAMSINLGCSLGSRNLKELFRGIAHILKAQGTAVISDPMNHDIVFTSGERPLAEVIEDIHTRLDNLNREVHRTNDSVIVKCLGTLDDVYRATFRYTGGQWHLVHKNGGLKLTDLNAGNEIWRKLPGPIMTRNWYHPRNEYLTAIQEAGKLRLDGEIFGDEHERAFADAAELETYNAGVGPDKQLGPEYIGCSPFFVMQLTKIN